MSGIHGYERIWRTTDHRAIPIKDLTDEHLINILNWLERTPPPARVPNREQRTDDYFWLRQEAMKRGLRWRNYSDQLPLRDGDSKLGVREWGERKFALENLIGKRVRVGIEVESTTLDGQLKLATTRGRLRSVEVLPEESNEELQRERSFHRSSQFYSFEDIARGRGGVPISQRRKGEVVTLASLRPGEKFRTAAGSDIFVKTVPIGVVSGDLAEQGHRIGESWSLYGNLVSDDGTNRCLVTNLVSGESNLRGSFEQVLRYEGHRIG